MPSQLASDVFVTHPLRPQAVLFGHTISQDAKDGAPTVWWSARKSWLSSVFLCVLCG
jgi:hypothetical protein